MPFKAKLLEIGLARVGVVRVLAPLQILADLPHQRGQILRLLRVPDLLLPRLYLLPRLTMAPARFSSRTPRS